jgi:hypothetical protein
VAEAPAVEKPSVIMGRAFSTIEKGRDAKSEDLAKALSDLDTVAMSNAQDDGLLREIRSFLSEVSTQTDRYSDEFIGIAKALNERIEKITELKRQGIVWDRPAKLVGDALRVLERGREAKDPARALEVLEAVAKANRRDVGLLREIDAFLSEMIQDKTRYPSNILGKAQMFSEELKVASVLAQLDNLQATPERERNFTEILNLVSGIQSILVQTSQLSNREKAVLKTRLANWTYNSVGLWNRWMDESREETLSVGRLLQDIEKLPGFGKYASTLADPTLRGLLEPVPNNQGTSFTQESVSEVTSEVMSGTST